MSIAERKCSVCGRSFIPSSGHVACPSCRAKNRRVPCPRCGVASVSPGARSCSGCRVLVGPLNPRWKGGRTIHKKGYVMVYVPDHPTTTKKNPYVMEHRLVMEETLGRTLFPEESVHHINGVKNDNRASNLELWVRPQPTGVRAKNAVEWARVILERYKGL